MSGSLQIVTVPCFKDNLSYLVLNTADKTAIAVDPGEAAPFFRAIESLSKKSGENYSLVAAIVTHHHHDHVGGLQEFPAIPTWSSITDKNRIPAAGAKGSKFTFESGREYSWIELTGGVNLTSENVGGANSVIQFDAIEIPGHTKGQIAVRVVGINPLSKAKEEHLFVGDTLFSFGCGRCLEGTPIQLFESLQKIKCLPVETILHFGHEYTNRNIGFWRKAHLEMPERCQEILDLDDLNRVEVQIESKAFWFRSAPTLGDEILTNPFLKMKTEVEFSDWRAKRDDY